MTLWKGTLMTQIFQKADSKPKDSIELRHYQIGLMISVLQNRCEQGLPWELLLQSIRQILESLPLASDDFDRAICHLTNCERYLQLNERGPAVYELRLMGRVLSG